MSRTLLRMLCVSVTFGCCEHLFAPVDRGSSHDTPVSATSQSYQDHHRHTQPWGHQDPYSPPTSWHKDGGHPQAYEPWGGSDYHRHTQPWGHQDPYSPSPERYRDYGSSQDYEPWDDSDNDGTGQQQLLEQIQQQIQDSHQHAVERINNASQEFKVQTDQVTSEAKQRQADARARIQSLGS